MALDTTQKRAAVLSIPWPDGSLGVVARGAVVRVYAGVFAGAATTTTTAVPTTTTTTTTTAAPFYLADCTITITA